MNYNKLTNWISKKINIQKRLIPVVSLYIISLMIPMRKHSLIAIAQLTGSTKSRFSKFLQNHSNLAIFTLQDLSKRQAIQFSESLSYLANNSLPWQIAIIIDSTIQHRSSRHPQNAKRFNHGKGFVIGHQWTNIVLLINDTIIPLPPIPFYSKSYCKKNNLLYRTENDLVVDFLTNLHLEEYIGEHDPKEVVVLADSGYDDKEIENTIIQKKWCFIIALKKSRTVKTKKEFLKNQKSKNWCSVEVFFKKNRYIKWQTIRVSLKRLKKKRMEFRIRQIIVYLRNVDKIQLICSEFKKRPKGRRKYLACSDLKVKARLIIIGYRIRWSIELFHKDVKMFLGFEDVATSSFESVTSHVHWVYCAYILLNFKIPGIPIEGKSVGEKGEIIKNIVERKELSRINQLLTQINGIQKFKNELRKALHEPWNVKNNILSSVGIC